jgi:hypothetical protein
VPGGFRTRPQRVPTTSPWDAGYIADTHGLEACSAFESSPEEALVEVVKAKDRWLVAAR